MVHVPEAKLQLHQPISSPLKLWCMGFLITISPHLETLFKKQKETKKTNKKFAS
jgi:hypothetical protein